MSTSENYEFEPDWINARTKKQYEPRDSGTMFPSSGSTQPIMQTDGLKEFYKTIVTYGLQTAYLIYREKSPVKLRKGEVEKTKHPKNVVIIGAGMAGLVAAYELVRVGHKVRILEMQHRVGGRVKTVSSERFYPGLWSDVGAMRIPGSGTEDDIEKKHYLTNLYAQRVFGLPTIPFENVTENAFYYLYGKRYSTKEWNANPEKFCNELWPGWDTKLTPNTKKKYCINGLASYYDVCMQFVRNEIRQANGGCPTVGDWTWWVDRWSRFSVIEFLTSSYEAIVSKITGPSPDRSLIDLLPWPRQAIVGFTAYNYTPELSTSLVELLRDDLGEWWKTPMHTLKGGLSTLPLAFTKNDTGIQLGEYIDFGMVVTKVTYTDSNDFSYPSKMSEKTPRPKVPMTAQNGKVPQRNLEYPKVSVTTRNDTSSQKIETIEGDVCIVTLPLNIIRQIPFEPPLRPEFADALMHITYSPSTKILLQCKTRFWEKENGGIFGGFSFTNLPIGQLHYPSNSDHKPKDGRGILMCYTWKQEALLFGSQPEKLAIAEAVEEVSLIHPDIKKNFEVGAIQAWYSDPTSQGAFALLKPFQIQHINEKLLYPYPKPDEKTPHPSPPPLYFAGEAISYTTGWIQGALESGLRAAYQFHSRNEKYYEAN